MNKKMKFALIVAVVLAGCAGAGGQPRHTVNKPELPTQSSPADTGEAMARDGNFSVWLQEFRGQALRAGISPSVFDEALGNVTPDPRVTDADTRQPEFVKPVWEYLASSVTLERVEKAKLMLISYGPLFDRIETNYGVDRRVVVAIWGLESNFGSFKGSFSVPRALATMGYQGRRTAYGRSQLMAALQILQARDIAAKDMVGSWAGAMGHTQFIPTTYLSHAVDADADGRRDIWSSVADALSSTANYLSAAKWERRVPWAVEVSLPQGFDYALADDTIRKSVSEWTALGVRAAGANGLELPATTIARLILPAGYRGPAFLVSRNFDAIMTYNNSTSYALAVSLLANQMGGGSGVQASWPLDERPLNKTEREEVQTRLNAGGFNAGKVDGMIGSGTRTAIRAFQKKADLPADGFASSLLLERLRQAK